MCRVLAAYLHVSREVYHADLLFIWDVNVACPGHFLEIFQPIKGVSFISDSSRKAMEPFATAVFPITSCRFEIIMKDHGFERNSLRGHETQLYRNFIPTREILRSVDKFLFDIDVRNLSSMHLRQTDMHAVLSSKQRATDASYDRFIDTRPANEKIYLLSDNPFGQKRFLDKYGDRIIVYKKIIISSNFVSHSHSIDCWNFDQKTDKKKKNITLPISYRYTSLQHTLIDVIISAKSIVFKGSPFSSLSDLVVRFRSVLKEAEKMQLMSNKSKINIKITHQNNINLTYTYV